MGSTERADLVEMVIAAIERNHALIESAEVTLRETQENALAQSISTSPPSDGEIQVESSPRVRWDSRVVVRGKQVRVDRTATSDTTAAIPTETLVSSRGIWTQYFPDGGTAWIRRDVEMPRVFPVDPREMAADGAHRSVADVLREDRIVSAEVSHAEDGSPEIHIVTSKAQDDETRYTFAAASGFLPCRVETRWPDGSLLQVVDVTYQSVLDGRAKFLKRARRRFYSQGFTRGPQATGWHQQLTSEVVGTVVINQPLAEKTFHVDLKPGTLVSDNTRLANYIVGGVATGPSPLWPYTAALVLLLLVLIVVRHIALVDRSRPQGV